MRCRCGPRPAQVETGGNASGSEDVEQLSFAAVAGAKRNGITTSQDGFSVSCKLNKYHVAKQSHSCLPKKKDVCPHSDLGVNA